MRLAYQAGVLQALQEHGLSFHHADGTSGGIFNLAMLLSGLSVQEMARSWRTVRIKDFVSYFPLRAYLNPLKLAAFGDADGILKKVFPHLGVDIAKINSERALSGTFNVCNYSRKTNEAIAHEAVTLQHLIAGVSLPIFMPAVKIQDDWYIDAVWIKDTNLTEAIRRGAEEVWLIWAIGNVHEYKSGSFNQYVHMIEMSANGALFAEFDFLNDLNARILKGDSPYGQRAPIKVHIIKPAYPLPLDTDLYFNRINSTTLIELGYADAKEHLLDGRAQPARVSPEATKMRSPGVAFSMRAKLRGVLLNQIAALHLSLFIHDVAAFVQTHQPYRLGASLRLENSPDTWYAYRGEVAWRPGAESADRRFCFEFRICIAGADYVLTGELGASPILLKKPEQPVTVTLYEGDSAHGNRVTASIFRMTAADSAYTKKSISFYNTRNWFEKRRAKNALKAYFLRP